ncbi:SAM-dependent methyltransferase [Mangrovihabitans endophyticus]|uniref:S-adenosyl methyltransferase n=1 Tax=Mangrovihabitans endophyticus TaxID=1751298 RepID=A0A8J3C4Y9_9ACTN|nr:SAM-dependent methyltransferase [Mangrovihabitans endophyticus]GGL10197.1 hypothetical protein GCM10012284_51180 [Mangrovihabitans endophyticus]
MDNVVTGLASGPPAEAGPPGIDTSVPHPARRYNYWLGGTDNFAADRESADAIERAFPGMRAGILANRDVLRRIVRYLATDAGIRQFLDVGTGLPTADNTHEVAQRIALDSRVVYVDNDPLITTYAKSLLAGSAEGATAYLEADLRDPEALLSAQQLRETLDLSRPVALMLIAVLHFIPGHGRARPLVRTLMDALPAGSYLAVTHVTMDVMPDDEKAMYRRMLDSGKIDIWPRDRDEFAALFDGLDMVEPGIVMTTDWPDATQSDVDLSRISIWTGVARKP